MKKAISVLLIVVLLFALAGCGKNYTAISAKLYFLDENLNYAVEIREIKAENKWKAMVEELIEGPSAEGLTNPLNGDIKVLSAEIVNGICVVDLSEEFSEYNTGGTLTESLAIYSIVNTLCANGADGVKINIEGNEEADFGGHFYLGDNFYFEPNMVRIEDR